MLKDFSFELVKRNISNEYSDYQFHFYFANLPDQTLEYHWECYSSYTNKYDLQRSTNVRNKQKLEVADFLSPSRRSSRVRDVASTYKIITAYSVSL